jgi:hypothetical protein
MFARLHYIHKLVFLGSLSFAALSPYTAANAANAASVAATPNANVNVNGAPGSVPPIPSTVPNGVPNTNNGINPSGAPGTIPPIPPAVSDGVNPTYTGINPNGAPGTIPPLPPSAVPDTVNAAPPNAVVAAPTVNTTGATSNQASVNAKANWKMEDRYWRSNFSNRPYAHDDVNYTMYRPAFQFGVAAFSQYNGRPFDDINQDQLRTSWQQTDPNSTLTWDQAQLAIRDAYDRLYERRLSDEPEPAAMTNP